MQYFIFFNSLAQNRFFLCTPPRAERPPSTCACSVARSVHVYRRITFSLSSTTPSPSSTHLHLFLGNGGLTWCSGLSRGVFEFTDLRCRTRAVTRLSSCKGRGSTYAMAPPRKNSAKPCTSPTGFTIITEVRGTVVVTSFQPVLAFRYLGRNEKHEKSKDNDQTFQEPQKRVRRGFVAREPWARSDARTRGRNTTARSVTRVPTAR